MLSDRLVIHRLLEHWGIDLKLSPELSVGLTVSLLVISLLVLVFIKPYKGQSSPEK
jgi:hypothetical protein